MPKTAFVYNNRMASYDLGPEHPLRPERLRMTYDLASAYGLFGGDSQLLEPKPAEEADILSFHNPAYVQTVKELGEGKEVPGAWRFGLGYGDNPPFIGMYEASVLYTGASLTAADSVISGRAERAFNISGGLHHAKAAMASGFCTFNDPVITINRLRSTYDRIAYIDIDAHHGDGVQEAFHETDRVLTISIHESGEYLFPGTGHVHEIGEGEGRGYSVNIPLSPSTTDDVYVWAFAEIVPPLISAYEPQVIVAQLGADSHFQDPLAHLLLTSEGFVKVVKTIIGFGKPLVALGGGGYNVSAVARLWTLAYAEMVERELPDPIPEGYRAHDIHHLRDATRPELTLTDYQLKSARRYAEERVRDLKSLVFPIHGLGISSS
ncbi:MAG TPA: acetoin utilization protein AcuC [Armatimonadota bacterium]|nr:acetoin utilization protein AcuC [Armatimonadota bacterium]